MLKKLSIDWKLPLAVCAVLMAVVVTLSVLTYREVARSSREAAADRVESFASQLVRGLESSRDKGLLRLTALASKQPVVDYLRSSERRASESEAARASLETLLTSIDSSGGAAAVELLGLNRQRLLAVGPDWERIAALPVDDFIASPTPSAGGVGPLLAVGDRVVVAYFAPVVFGEEAAGHVVLWSYVPLSSATRSEVVGFLGLDASVRIGSAGGLWIDFERIVSQPALDLTPTGHVARIARPDGVQLETVVHAKDAPWIVVVDYPERVVMEPVRRLADRTGIVALLLLLAGFGGIWWTARRITGPLRELTLASESLVGGSREVPAAASADEIVRLRSTFQRMSERVQEAQRRLEAKVVELRDAKECEAAARATAEHANSRKDEFLAMLAHELRNPLSPILCALTVVRHPRASEADREESFAVIERQVLNMSRMVDDLLDVSRITTGTVALKRRRADIATLVHHAIETARPLIEAKQHRVICSLPDRPLTIEADAARMEQVLANLATNAAKYTEPGGCIWVSAAREADEIVFRVRDNGIGIPSGHLPRVFDLFYQGDGSILRSRGGLGIGLTLVRKIVELHGGTVSASSPGEGKGSEFVVRVPADAEAEEHLETPSRAGAPHAASESLRVLVVEDARDTRELLKVVLSLDGHEVRTAEDGHEGLASFRTFDPHVVVLDIGLPGLNGFEVARRIRQEASQHVLLIAATGYGDAETRARVREVGFDEHLVKPIAHAELTSIIARVTPGRDRVATSTKS